MPLPRFFSNMIGPFFFSFYSFFWGGGAYKVFYFNRLNSGEAAPNQCTDLIRVSEY